ncbi:eukaryotic translation initiation factor 3 subunit-like protein [Purpureocillium lavendulum]|uniref:Eukaryotic translation initiation factor 3 subunit H n=1 Tax=Purpureocillium lavendulum TaxID=1247861 RepID=A0AB34FZZ4_9HYPO|nr:eukaryotic translation initiation factor 3 subunit-like protein [Purpureocillium lavendulum]
MAARTQTALPVDVPVFSREKEAISALQNDVLSRDRFIVQSPYSDPDHLLDLDTLNNENALLAQALERLRATRDDYATASYTESFNWSEVLGELRRLARASGRGFKETSFYIVAFRSQIKPSTEYSHLGELDKAAHAEAVASGGFLKYWFGSPDAELRNLATCIWRSREDALEGGRGPAHRKAAGSTRALYAYWKIDQHRLIVRDNVDSWEIVPWNDSIFHQTKRSRISVDPNIRASSPLCVHAGIQSFPNETANMSDSLKDAPFQAVQVEALVVMKIAKHCSSSFPTTATGSIVGMDQNNLLEITNTFPFPTVDGTTADSHQNDASQIAAAAPRQKANVAYQNEMIRHLKEVNVDANNVGWYTSATMGNFVSMSFIENQYHYQKDNSRTVALVYDTSKSSQGNLTLRAFRLTTTFMAAYKEGKFTTENLQKSKLSFRDILAELPITIHNSHLLTTFLHQVPARPSQGEIEQPNSLADLKNADSRTPLYPSIDNLDLSIDPFLEKTCDLLLESIESHYTDLNNFQFYQRQLGREQAKITQWQAKRKAENAQRTVAKQPLLPEDEWQRLFKLPQEPSRLEGMLNAKQVDQYSKQVDGFTANVSAKMFAVRENLLPQ